MELKNILNELSYLEVDYLSLRKVIKKSISTSVRNEIFEGLSSSLDSGIMIEVLANGQFGHAATNSLELEEIKKMAAVARDSAIASSKYALTKFTLEQRPNNSGSYKGPAVKSIDDFNPKEMNELLTKLTKEMNLSSEIISRSASFTINEMQTHFVATNGSNIEQTFIRTNLALSASASSDKGNQSRSFGDDMGSQYGLEMIDEVKLLEVAKRIAQESLVLLNAPECPTEEMDLILAPDQLYLQIHESIGHPLELDRILGDERNYAGWSFVKPSDFGSLKYGSQLMNITFDPTVLGQNASYAADDIGNLATREYLIKDGLLLKGLGSLESQARLNVGGVASQRATSWNRAPIDRMGNVNLEPGTSTLDEMIKSVKRGVLMRTTKSWSIDDYRNKFQFGCEFGQLIEDGKLTTIVKNPNYRGVTAPFWNKLKMVGDKSTFEVGGLGNCGKGEPNQVIFVGHAAPTCLFQEVEVFGGGK